MTTLDEFLATAEAAIALGLHLQTINRFCRLGCPRRFRPAEMGNPGLFERIKVESMALDSPLQGLEDKAAIRDLMARYARGMDRPDFDLIAFSFTPDAYASYGGGGIRWEAQGRDNIVD